MDGTGFPGLKFSGIETPPAPLDATHPHDFSEHQIQPNVIVSHTKHGLEVISLSHGNPIMALSLTHGQTFVDVDGDGMVDKLMVLEDEQQVAAKASSFAHEGGEILPCTLMVVSGLPPKAQLFNASVCMSGHALSDPLSHLSRVSRTTSISAASPLVLRKMDPRTLKHEAAERDIFVAINTGTGTAFSGSGEYHWQIKGLPAWSPSFDAHSALAFEPSSRLVDDVGSHDTVTCAILLQGEYSAALVSREGAILSSAEIPKRPIAAPVLGDFDNDGFNDVVVITADAILGYRTHVTESVRGMLIVIIVLVIIALFLFVSNIQAEIVVPPISAARNDGGVTSVERPAPRKVFVMKRSTDDYHLD